MRILQLMAGARHGGAETAFVDMCMALKEAGHDIHVATRANPVRVPRLRAAGIPVHLLPFGGPIDVYTPLALCRLILKIRPDVIQTWMSRAPAKLPPRFLLPRRLYPLVVARLGGYYKLKNFRHADYFTTITPLIRDYLIENGVAPERVRHINNFAETEDHAVPVDRATLGTPPDVPLVLALGRLHECKALDVLIKAVAMVPSLHLWIAGEGPERESLEKLIAALGVGGRVHLLGWRSDRAALLQAADMCAFVSRYEPFGTVFVQAWAQHVPVVVSNADGPRQFVRPEEDGLMVPVDDVPALVAALERLSQDVTLRTRLAEAGYRHYRTEFTQENTVFEYIRFYEEILGPYK